MDHISHEIARLPDCRKNRRLKTSKKEKKAGDIQQEKRDKIYERSDIFYTHIHTHPYIHTRL